MSRLVVVSNRVPSGPRAASTGGLAVGLLGAMRESGGLWFGWSGELVDEDEAGEPRHDSAGRISFATIDLPRAAFDAYYNGFGNRVLWPLFHYRIDLCEFDRADYAGYREVNRLFAEKLLPLLRPDDTIWVHDYHLVEVAQTLRERGATQPIGFFLHTPFPAWQVLLTLPNHARIMRALAAYDLVGLQTGTDLRAFWDYMVDEAGGEVDDKGFVHAFGRIFRANYYPIGIDVETVEEDSGKAPGERQAKRLEASLAGRAMLIGVDRLDYSKGLPERFAAFERLLETHPEYRGHLVYMQIAPPTRTAVPEYLEIRRELEAAAGRINGRYAEFDWVPIRYLNKTMSHRALMGFFRHSRIALVTPLRDGMNLVAKEYVAAQDPENPGVLVLSRFAGAARELGDALIVNPYDPSDVAAAIRRGLEMPLDERKDRREAMMEVLRRQDIHAWRRQFLDELHDTAAKLRS